MYSIILITTKYIVHYLVEYNSNTAYQIEIEIISEIQLMYH